MARPSFLMVGNKLKRLKGLILVRDLLYFLEQVSSVLIEGFAHANFIEEGAIAKQAMQGRYGLFLCRFFVKF